MADETKPCPWCGETILAVAKKCKHCGEFLTDEAPAVVTATAPNTTEQQGEQPVWRFHGMLWRCIEHEKSSCRECAKRAPMPTQSGEKGDLFPGTMHGAAAMVCPHCNVAGQVSTKQVKQKKGVSGGKATAAVLTAGISMLGTGLSRKEKVTEARCGNCGSVWHF